MSVSCLTGSFFDIDQFKPVYCQVINLHINDVSLLSDQFFLVTDQFKPGNLHINDVSLLSDQFVLVTDQFKPVYCQVT